MLALVSSWLVTAALAAPQDAFGRGGAEVPLEPAVRAAVLEKAIATLHEAYVFPEVAAAIEKKLRERASRGEYNAVTGSRAFAAALTEHLQEVSRDKHMRVFFEAEPIPDRPPVAPPTPEDREADRAYASIFNYGFARVERLSGNLGYLAPGQFFEPELMAETAAAAMTFVASTDALIVDLRDCGGGSPEGVVHLASYFFDASPPVHLNDIYDRVEGKTTEYWSEKSLAGKRYVGKPVFVLTRSTTFSGAEEFAYVLQAPKRATVVGETTGGGANPGDTRKIGEHFALFVSTGRSINPITKTNWEGTGVTPDVEVAAKHALDVAQLLALRELLPKTTNGMVRGARTEFAGELEAKLKRAGVTIPAPPTR